MVARYGRKSPRARAKRRGASKGKRAREPEKKRKKRKPAPPAKAKRKRKPAPEPRPTKGKARPKTKKTTKKPAVRPKTQPRSKAAKKTPAERRAAAARKGARTRKRNAALARKAAEARSAAAKRGAATRRRNAARLRKLEAAQKEYEAAQKQKLRGAPGAKKRVREARAELRSLVETEEQRKKREFEEELDKVFDRRRKEREKLEEMRAEGRRLREEEEARLGRTLTEERTEAVVEQARQRVLKLAKAAREMLPEADNRRRRFEGASGALGDKREAYVNMIVDEESIDAIVAIVKEALSHLPGGFPFWMATYWLTAVGNELVGSFKLRVDKVTAPEDRAIIREELQALMVNSSGVQRNARGVLKQLRADMLGYTTARFGRTEVFLHQVSVWNYTRRADSEDEGGG